MRPPRIIFGFGMLLFAGIFVAGFGSAVWQLWNHLMPQIFGLPAIGFWQALGLLSLSWLLFGGMRGPFGHRGGGRRNFMRGKWDRMTPEQREAVRANFRKHCGAEPPVGEAGAPRRA
jgi:hypothetical protein